MNYGDAWDHTHDLVANMKSMDAALRQVKEALDELTKDLGGSKKEDSEEEEPAVRKVHWTPANLLITFKFLDLCYWMQFMVTHDADHNSNTYGGYYSQIGQCVIHTGNGVAEKEYASMDTPWKVYEWKQPSRTPPTYSITRNAFDMEEDSDRVDAPENRVNLAGPDINPSLGLVWLIYTYYTAYYKRIEQTKGPGS